MNASQISVYLAVGPGRLNNLVVTCALYINYGSRDRITERLGFGRELKDHLVPQLQFWACLHLVEHLELRTVRVQAQVRCSCAVRTATCSTRMTRSRCGTSAAHPHPVFGKKNKALMKMKVHSTPIPSPK